MMLKKKNKRNYSKIYNFWFLYSKEPLVVTTEFYYNDTAEELLVMDSSHTNDVEWWIASSMKCQYLPEKDYIVNHLLVTS